MSSGSNPDSDSSFSDDFSYFSRNFSNNHFEAEMEEANEKNVLYMEEEDEDWEYEERSLVVEESTKEKITKVPRFKIYLDEDPRSRWNTLLDYYREEIYADKITTIAGKFAKPIIDSILVPIAAIGAYSNIVLFSDEINAIAARLRMPVGIIVALQFIYESAAKCTSIVVDDPSGGPPIHIRTMDWEMEFLKPLTCEIECYRNQKLVFVATTWPAYLGILTAMKPGAFSVSVNFRLSNQQSYFENIKQAILYAWPIGFLVRKVMEEDATFEEAVANLSNSKIIAPVYFTVCGSQPGEGQLITRTRSSQLSPWNLKIDGAIVQPNIDHFSDNRDENILYSIERRELARELIQSGVHCSDLTIDPEKLWGLISNYPILNPLTVSGTLMCPRREIIETRLPQNYELGFRSCENPLPHGGVAKKKCTSCLKFFNPDLNPRGFCAHSGSWHGSYSDCDYIKCGIGLGKNIGRCHWSCCYSLSEKKKSCKLSGKHKGEE